MEIRDAPPPNKTKISIEDKIVSLYKTRYQGFNLLHFQEKLINHLPAQDIPAYTTMRRIMSDHQLLNKTKRKHKKSHKVRNRYEKEGIFAQIDGSHHVWFGDIESCLIAIIDDATGKILSARFSPTETTLDTMRVAQEAIHEYGRFQIIYSDKAGIFGDGKRANFTNFKRAMKHLDILPVLAHSPQAKGRVERLFRTLQDRLISEMRLRNIRNLEEANIYLSKFIIEFNKKFSVTPISNELAYRPITPGTDFKEVFSMIEVRTIQSGDLIHFNREKYLVKSKTPARLKGRWVEVRTYQDRTIAFYLENQKIEVEKMQKYQRTG